MGGMMDMKCEGMLKMNGKNTMLGKPRHTMGGESKSHNDADMRGMKEACVKG